MVPTWGLISDSAMLSMLTLRGESRLFSVVDSIDLCIFIYSLPCTTLKVKNVCWATKGITSSFFVSFFSPLT